MIYLQTVRPRGKRADLYRLQPEVVANDNPLEPDTEPSNTSSSFDGEMILRVVQHVDEIAVQILKSIRALNEVDISIRREI